MMWPHEIDVSVEEERELALPPRLDGPPTINPGNASDLYDLGGASDSMVILDRERHLRCSFPRLSRRDTDEVERKNLIACRLRHGDLQRIEQTCSHRVGMEARRDS